MSYHLVRCRYFILSHLIWWDGICGPTLTFFSIWTITSLPLTGNDTFVGTLICQGKRVKISASLVIVHITVPYIRCKPIRGLHTSTSCSVCVHLYFSISAPFPEFGLSFPLSFSSSSSDSFPGCNVKHHLTKYLSNSWTFCENSRANTYVIFLFLFITISLWRFVLWLLCIVIFFLKNENIQAILWKKSNEEIKEDVVLLSYFF